MIDDVTLITQRVPTDCSACCTAMALRMSYEDVIKVKGDQGGWTGPDFDDVFERLGFDIIAQPRFFRPKDAAILSVPSRTRPEGYHAIYYEHGRIYDPTPRRANRYNLADAVTNPHTIFYQWTALEAVTTEAPNDEPA